LTTVDRFGGRGGELNPLLRRARRAGWTVTRQSSGHWRWFDPEGRLILTTGGTPNGRGVHFAMARLKKAGLR
jgi:hypothetical protein